MTETLSPFWAPRVVAPPPPARGNRLVDRPTVDPDWRDHASCRGEGGHGSIWLYPHLHTMANVEKTRLRCLRCPVLSECAADLSTPPVGITAGKVFWVEGKPGRKESPCEWCLEPTRYRFCSRTCMDRHVYQQRIAAAGAYDPAPLLAYLGLGSANEHGRRCGVSRRTIHRWRGGQLVTGFRAELIAHRLNTTTETIWGL